MDNNTHNKQEQDIRFVAKRYSEGALDVDKAWNAFARKQGIQRRAVLRRYWMGAAATLLLLIGLGGRWLMESRQPEWVVVATLSGEVKDVILPDNTLISMAGNSEIRYDKKQFGKERRLVEMNGKAFFEVTRDEASPFSVQTERTSVTVLGTSFQLEEQETATSLYVSTGKVRFASEAGDELVLTANQAAVYSQAEGMQVVEEEEKGLNFQSWKTRELRFRETPLDKVIQDLQTTYNQQVINRSPQNDGLKLTAFFEDMPLEDVLLVINETLDVDLVAQPQQ